MFQNFKNCNLSLNNNSFVISDAELNQSIGLDSPYKYDERVNDRFLPNKNYEGNLRISYYLTGGDPLKNYIYSQENQRITGSICGITFNQGYLTSYDINCQPNSPVLVNANIQFFDKLQGSFVNTNPQNKQGTILNLYNVSINNLSDYTVNTLNFISQASFSYNCQVFPSYEFVDTGTPPTEAKRVSIGERTIAAEFISDNVNMDLPLSGEKFGITFTFINPHSTGINENFGCSGRINSKTLNIQAGNLHTHQIRVQQNHLNNFGNIGSVVISDVAGVFTIYSENGYHSFTSTDNQLKYIDKIMVGDTDCPDFSYFDILGSNGVIVTTPPSITNDILTVQTTRGNLVWPNVLTFGYSGMPITGLSMYSGFPGSIITITGENFYRISDVYFGNERANFQVVTPRSIQAIVPDRGTTYPVKVISSKRNVTGVSSGLFFCKPEITTVTPLSGVWKDTLTVGGTNFSGITGIKFGNADAYSFSILSNSIISVQTPETGAGFASGYLTIYGSGGSAKSYSRYNPHVPIYSYNPISGVFFDQVNIYTKVDTGYLYPLSGGYKVRFGNIDTIFYPSGYETNHDNKTGCLTGQIPSLSRDDYIYIYQPDGVSTYNPHSLKFNVIGEPEIYSFAPATVRKYQFFTPVMNGKNFKFFTQKPFYFALSGGNPTCVQFYTNVVSNSGGAADTMYVPNVIITGHTGIYSAIVKNLASTAVFSGALQVLTGVNQARLAGGTVITASTIPLKSTYYAIDGSTGTFSALSCTTTPYANYFQLAAKNLMDVSVVYIGMYNLPTLGGKFPHQSGKIELYEKNAGTPIFSVNSYSSLSGLSVPTYRSLVNPGELGGYTGIKNIRIYTPTGGSSSTHYFGVSEIEIY